MSTTDRNAVSSCALKFLAANPDCTPKDAATHGIRAHFNLGPREGVWSGSPAARSMGYKSSAGDTDLLPLIATELAAEVSKQASPACPNCGQSIAGHPDDGCLLFTMVQVLRERGGHTPEQLQALHAAVDPSKLWDAIAPLVDRLAQGGLNR